MKQYDIKTAFLNGKLSEEIYMKQLPGFVEEFKVCKVNKSLYGLKQAAISWNQELDRVLLSCGCVQSDFDKSLYTVNRDGDVAYVLIYVDDLLITGVSNGVIDHVVQSIQKEFEIKDLGDVSTFLGIEVEKDAAGDFYVSQRNYINKIVVKAGLVNAKISKVPLNPGHEKLESSEQIPDHQYRKSIGMLCMFLLTQDQILPPVCRY